MYSDDEKLELLKDLKEMESVKADVEDEGKILQDDLIDYFNDNLGDGEDLKFRLELYFYEFKLFSRKDIRLGNNEFTVYLNAYDINFNQLRLVKKDFDKFELLISGEVEENNSRLNLNFIKSL